MDGSATVQKMLQTLVTTSSTVYFSYVPVLLLFYGDFHYEHSYEDYKERKPFDESAGPEGVTKLITEALDVADAVIHEGGEGEVEEDKNKTKPAAYRIQRRQTKNCPVRVMEPKLSAFKKEEIKREVNIKLNKLGRLPGMTWSSYLCQHIYESDDAVAFKKTRRWGLREELKDLFSQEKLMIMADENFSSVYLRGGVIFTSAQLIKGEGVKHILHILHLDFFILTKAKIGEEESGE